MRGFLDSLLSFAVAIAVGAAVVYASGYSPLLTYYSMFVVPFTDVVYITSALAAATPIILTGLTFALGLKAGLFNIGGEGQAYMGALGAVIASYFFAGLLALPLSFIIGIGLAVLWALVPALLRTTRGVNEVVSTIMMNWIAYWLTIMEASTTFSNPMQPSETIKTPPQARLTPLLPDTSLTASFFIAVAAALLVHWMLERSVVGYELSVAGANPTAARVAGIPQSRVILYSFALGGVTSGMAGVLQVVAMPPSYSLATNLANVYGLGFDGITAAMLGRGSPLGTLAAALFLGLMEEGARHMQAIALTPFEFVKMLQGIMILVIAIRMLEVWRGRRR
ncbi:ABC transporter permease [Thermoproteus tenax]|uniref:Simple sugar transport system permease protein n=1 Tax=Thermoproteus tenax (strain ATCC 35583 / DSM 2078 / JCM 9277 / NBRC 100435 / Kra 1) TaxID=768679 RepID=G4RJL8_THETK|nr:ABC transporter permease [Thermoproteus tenax]CCC81763.1 simple sugar transport system permease protein [Thermoproteus tenax Kra 1]